MLRLSASIFATPFTVAFSSPPTPSTKSAEILGVVGPAFQKQGFFFCSVPPVHVQGCALIAPHSPYVR